MLYKKLHFIIIPLIVLPINLYAFDSHREIVSSVKKLCLAPSNKKSLFYEVSAKGNVNLKIKIIGLAGAKSNFTLKEWNGIQRVLQKDQINDNKSYRNCTMTLTPIFINKFYSGVESENKKKTLIEARSSKNITYGNNSPIIEKFNGEINFN